MDDESSIGVLSETSKGTPRFEARNQVLNVLPIQSTLYSQNDDFERFGALPGGPPIPARSGTVWNPSFGTVEG